MTFKPGPLGTGLTTGFRGIWQDTVVARERVLAKLNNNSRIYPDMLLGAPVVYAGAASLQDDACRSINASRLLALYAGSVPTLL